MSLFFKYIKPIADLIITLLLWLYFTLGYMVFFFPFYLLAFVFSGDQEKSFQKLNHIFYKGFFLLVRAIPRQKLHVDKDVLSVRSSVIVCNHLSYLDPIFIISLFEKHKTIVKSTFFKLPLFGWVLKTSGYIPSASGGEFNLLMIQCMENMEEYLASGGNLFVFPEGTRSRDGMIGSFNKGAFKIAKRCNAPVKVLFIRNTNMLFRPGHFLFNTCVENTISVQLISSFEPGSFSISDMSEQVHCLFEKNSFKS